MLSVPRECCLMCVCIICSSGREAGNFLLHCWNLCYRIQSQRPSRSPAYNQSKRLVQSWNRWKALHAVTHCQSKPFQFQEQRAPALLNRGGGGVPQFLDIWKTKWQKFTLIQPRIRLQHQNHLVSSLCPYTGGYKLVSPAFFRPENHLNLLLNINKWSLISINRFWLHTAAFPSGHSAIPVKLGKAA